MVMGPTCVLLSDEACCVPDNTDAVRDGRWLLVLATDHRAPSAEICFWLLYAVGVFRAPRGVRTVDLIFSEDQTDIIEQEKGIRWMPWHQEAMKDVARCEKPRGAASRL